LCRYPYGAPTPQKGGQRSIRKGIGVSYLGWRLQAAIDARGEKGWRPTVVIELNESADQELVR
jgi:hypothetical protein